MKNLLLPFLFFGIAPLLSAQIVFSKAYDIENHMENAMRVVPIDDHLITVGLGANEEIGLPSFFALKTDLLGNEIWSFAIDGIERLRQNVVTYNEEFVFAAILDYNETIPEEKIIQIAPDGDYSFFSPYQTYETFLEDPTILEVFETPTGFAANIRERLENPTSTRYSVLTYDEDFTVQNLTVYKEPTDAFGVRRLACDPTGGYVASGAVLLFGDIIYSIRKTDEIGTEEWTYNLEDAPFIFVEPAIIVNNIGEIFVSYIEDKVNPLTNMFEISLKIIKLDQNGNILWENKFQGQNFISIKNFFLTDNNDLIAVGSARFPDEEFGLGKTVCLDQDGNVLWERIYNDERFGISFSGLNDGFDLENGDLIFSGFIFDTLNNGFQSPEDFWLLRVGPDGCVLPDCGYYNEITPVEELTPIPENNYRLTPTIAENNIRIQKENPPSNLELLAITIVNISGQQMLNVNQQNLPYEINITTFPPGFYFVRLANHSGQTQTLKFVKP